MNVRLTTKVFLPKTVRFAVRWWSDSGKLGRLHESPTINLAAFPSSDKKLMHTPCCDPAFLAMMKVVSFSTQDPWQEYTEMEYTNADLEALNAE